MITEYQASFLPPSKYITFTSKLKNPYHPRARDANITSVRTRHVSKQQTSLSPKARMPSVPPKTDVSFAQRLSLTKVTKPLCVVDYTTVYQNDFQAWTPEKLKSFPLKASISTNKTFPETNRASTARGKDFAVKDRKPEAITTYRVDYVAHPVQPRINKVLAANKSGKVLLGTSAVGQEWIELFQQIRISLTDIEDQNLPAVRKLHTTKFNRPMFEASQKSPSTWQLYETRTKPLQNGSNTVVGRKIIDYVAKGPYQKLKDAANMCDCDGMEKNHHPAEEVGLTAFQCSSSMFWSTDRRNEPGLSEPSLTSATC